MTHDLRRRPKQFLSKGILYTYHCGRRILAAPASPEFQVEIAAAESAAKRAQVNPPPLAIFNYVRSDEFKRLPPDVRARIKAALKSVRATDGHDARINDKGATNRKTR